MRADAFLINIANVRYKALLGKRSGRYPGRQMLMMHKPFSEQNANIIPSCYHVCHCNGFAIRNTFDIEINRWVGSCIEEGLTCAHDSKLMCSFARGLHLRKHDANDQHPCPLIENKVNSR